VFDIGFWELSLIMLLALLIVGPERLPGLVSTIGNWAGRAKFMARSLRMQVERELAREVAEKAEKEGKPPPEKPQAEQTPVQRAAEAAQAAEEAALAAARAKQQDVQKLAESQADDRSQQD
jgi:sec-independent protein translocase protein TatB